MRRRYFSVPLVSMLLISLVLLLTVRCSRDTQQARRVILIGIDGMGVTGFQQASTPNLDALVREGALSLHARGVMPTVSAPNWGSHLLGAGPEQHGITYNGWTTVDHVIEPVVSDGEGYFPSIFNLIRDQRPAAVTGFFYDWGALADLYNPAMISHSEFTDGYASTFRKAGAWILANDPLFTFIYAGHPDEAGHAHGWGSPGYIRALEDVDAAIGEFLETLRKEGLYEDAHIVVVSDHGGTVHGHGGISMEELETPWIIAGPGIIRNKLIRQPVDVANTAATIAYLCRLEVPYAWTGRPVLGAFRNSKFSAKNTESFVHQPLASIPGGLYDETMAFSFKVSSPEVMIRYTVDGSDPDPGSPVY